MKADIHPAYKQITVTCSCGNSFKTGSTLTADRLIDICSQCHPFFTGEQKAAATGGQIERFNQRFGALKMGKKANKDQTVKK